MTFPEIYKFKINKKIGKKICYTLYEAEDQITENLVFLKVLDEELSKNDDAAAHFLHSARMLKMFNNPNIYKVYDYGSDQGNHYIATEPVEWEPLSSIIKEIFSLSFQDLIEICKRIGSTLRYAHLHGLVHGFLNPRSIYINSTGSIKIDDFGLNWYIPELIKGDDRDSLYVTQYISPQFYDVKEQLDGRVDIYSLGIILFNMVNGSPPFTGNTISAIKNQHMEAKIPSLNLVDLDLPDDLENIIIRSLHNNTASRFQNLKELLDTLENLKRDFLSVSESTGQFPALENNLKFEPNKSQQYFFEDPSEFEEKGASSFILQSRSLLNVIGSIFTSKKFVFTGLTLLIFLILFFISKNKVLIPFLDKQVPTEFNEIKSTTNPVTQIAEMLPEEGIPSHSENSGEKKQDFMAQSDTAEVLLASNDEMRLDTNSTNSSYLKEISSAEKKNTPKKDIKQNEVTTEIPVAKHEIKVTKKVPSPPKAKPTTVHTASVRFNVKSENKPVEAFVFIDDQFKGKTDVNGNIEIADLVANNSYTVKISKKGYDTITKEITDITKSQTYNFSIGRNLDIFGTLILDAQPKADSIFVDGQIHRGEAPLKVTLPWGEHRIRYVNVGLNKSWEQAVNLKVGQVLRVKHDFAMAEFGKVAVSLKNAATFGFGFVYIDGKLWNGKPNTTPLEVQLSVGSHTIEVRREGFSSIPKDIIVVVEKDVTKYVAFTFTKL